MGRLFPFNQPEVVLNSGYVDFIVNGPGDNTFPALLTALDNNIPYEFIPNLIYKNFEGVLVKTKKEGLLNQDKLPMLPYEHLNNFYPIKRYLGKTYLGKKTLAYHSISGAPLPVLFVRLFQFIMLVGKENLLKISIKMC